MDIIEAIKSGKRFRRPGYKWNAHNDVIGFVNEEDSYQGWCTFDFLLAEDFEIEEEKVEITREQLKSAIDKVLHSPSLSVDSTTHLYDDIQTKLAKELFK